MRHTLLFALLLLSLVGLTWCESTSTSSSSLAVASSPVDVESEAKVDQLDVNAVPQDPPPTDVPSPTPLPSPMPFPIPITPASVLEKLKAIRLLIEERWNLAPEDVKAQKQAAYDRLVAMLDLAIKRLEAIVLMEQETTPPTTIALGEKSKFDISSLSGLTSALESEGYTEVKDYLMGTSSSSSSMTESDLNEVDDEFSISQRRGGRGRGMGGRRGGFGRGRGGMGRRGFGRRGFGRRGFGRRGFGRRGFGRRGFGRRGFGRRGFGRRGFGRRGWGRRGWGRRGWGRRGWGRRRWGRRGWWGGYPHWHDDFDVIDVDPVFIEPEIITTPVVVPVPGVVPVDVDPNFDGIGGPNIDIDIDVAQ